MAARCAFSTTCAVPYRGLWGLVVVRLSWLSDRVLVAQSRGVLGLTPGGCQPFRFPLFFCLITSKFIYFQCETRCSEQLTLLFCYSAVLFFHAVCFTDSLSPCTGTGKTTTLRRLIALNPNWKFLYCVYNKLVTTHCTGNCYSIVLSHYCTSNDAYTWIDRPRQKLIVHDNTCTPTSTAGCTMHIDSLVITLRNFVF